MKMKNILNKINISALNVYISNSYIKKLYVVSVTTRYNGIQLPVYLLEA